MQYLPSEWIPQEQIEVPLRCSKVYCAQFERKSSRDGYIEIFTDEAEKKQDEARRLAVVFNREIIE